MPHSTCSACSMHTRSGAWHHGIGARACLTGIDDLYLKVTASISQIDVTGSVQARPRSYGGEDEVQGTAKHFLQEQEGRVLCN